MTHGKTKLSTSMKQVSGVTEEVGKEEGREKG